VLAGAIRAIVQKVVLVWIIPFGLPVLVAGIGYAQKLPWFYLAVGSALTFGGISVGLVNFEIWRSQRRVPGKLSFAGVRVFISPDGKRLGLGVQLASSAVFPLDFECTEVRTQIANTVPSKKGFERARFSIPANGGAHFDDHPIDVAPQPNTSFDGALEFRIRYDRANSTALSHELVIKRHGLIVCDAQGALRSATWYED
jgi:hypothetical protein